MSDRSKVNSDPFVVSDDITWFAGGQELEVAECNGEVSEITTQNESYQTRSAPYEIIENCKQLSEDLKYVSGIPELCDVLFLVGEKREPVHAIRAVLAMRSRVFYRIFYASKTDKQMDIVGNPRSRKSLSKFTIFQSSAMKSQSASNLSSKNVGTSVPLVDGELSKQVVVINEFDVDVFRELIHYLHTGCVLLQPKSVIGLMNAADHYGVDNLRDLCSKFSRKCISLDSVCYLLTTAEKYIQYKSTKMLMQSVLDFVDKNGEAVLRLNDIIYLPRHVMDLVLSREDLASQVTKYHAAERWAHYYSTRVDKSVTFKEAVVPFMKHIRFFEIPTNVLVNKIRPLEIVPDDVLIKALAYQADPDSLPVDELVKDSPLSPRVRQRVFPRSGSVDYLNSVIHRQSAKSENEELPKRLKFRHASSYHLENISPLHCYDTPCTNTLDVNTLRSDSRRNTHSLGRHAHHVDRLHLNASSPEGSCSDSGIQEAEYASMLQPSPTQTEVHSLEKSELNNRRNPPEVPPRPPALQPRIANKPPVPQQKPKKLLAEAEPREITFQCRM